jgi:hypothetical protein
MRITERGESSVISLEPGLAHLGVCSPDETPRIPKVSRQSECVAFRAPSPGIFAGRVYGTLQTPPLQNRTSKLGCRGKGPAYGRVECGKFCVDDKEKHQVPTSGICQGQPHSHKKSSLLQGMGAAPGHGSMC